MKSELNLSDMRYGLGERDELAFNQTDADFYDKLLDGFNRLKKKPAVIIGSDSFHRNHYLPPLLQSDVHNSQLYNRYAMDTECDVDPLILHPSKDAVWKWRESSIVLYEQVKKRFNDNPLSSAEVNIIDSYPSLVQCGGRRVGRSFTNEVTNKFIGEYLSFFDPINPTLGKLSLVINARLNPKNRKAYTKVKEPNVWHYVGTDPGSSKSIYELHGIATSVTLMQSLIDEIVDDES